MRALRTEVNLSETMSRAFDTASALPSVIVLKDATYRPGFFATQPIKDYGAVPRLMVALARKRPDNGWAWCALAFGRFVVFESYLPVGACREIVQDTDYHNGN